MYGDTCEATHVRREQSTDVLDLRMDCLNRNRDSLGALTDVLAAADDDMVSKAIDAAAALPDVARCADVPCCAGWFRHRAIRCYASRSIACASVRPRPARLAMQVAGSKASRRRSHCSTTR